MIGGSAHTLQDCERLLTKAVDYISLGPFRSIEAKGAIPAVLGLRGYLAIMDVLATETPILGVGGITTNDVTAIVETGISGLAVSGDITRNFNMIKVFNELLKASATAEKRHSFK